MTFTADNSVTSGDPRFYVVRNNERQIEHARDVVALDEEVKAALSRIRSSKIEPDGKFQIRETWGSAVERVLRRHQLVDGQYNAWEIDISQLTRHRFYLVDGGFVATDARRLGSRASLPAGQLQLFRSGPGSIIITEALILKLRRTLGT